MSDQSALKLMYSKNSNGDPHSKTNDASNSKTNQTIKNYQLYLKKLCQNYLINSDLRDIGKTLDKSYW